MKNFACKKELLMIFLFFLINFGRFLKFVDRPVSARMEPKSALWSLDIIRDSSCEILAGSGQRIIFCLNLKWYQKNGRFCAFFGWFLS